jgi:RNA polymerase subunit RPABC4/transcription elongation factor Spt4
MEKNDEANARINVTQNTEQMKGDNLMNESKNCKTLLITLAGLLFIFISLPSHAYAMFGTQDLILFLPIISLWLLFGIVSAVIAARKDAGCLGFILGVLLGPFGILIALFMKGNRKACPLCKELVNKDAKICPHCQREILSEKTNIKYKVRIIVPSESKHKVFITKELSKDFEWSYDKAEDVLNKQIALVFKNKDDALVCMEKFKNLGCKAELNEN